MRNRVLLLSSVLSSLAGGAMAQQTDTSTVILDPVLVSAPLETSRSEQVEGTTILDGAALDRLRAPTLGETLDRTPGVSATQFGPGASRPVIRGQGGPRLRVMQNGIDSFDASVVSPDHAVAVPMGGASRVEVLRGPATLLYGSSAIGGVVNVIDGRIPDALPEGGADGSARLEYGSGAEEKSGFAGIDAAVTDRFVVHGEGSFLNADDYRIDGYANEEAREHGSKGRVDNSAIRSRSGALGASYLGDTAYAGFALSQFDSYYGVPGGHHHHHEDHGGAEEEEEHGGVRIDMRQTRLDGKFGFYDPLPMLDELRFRFGYADYRHDEIESSGEIGTRFDSENIEGRIEAVHEPFGAIEGVIGLQAGRRDFSAEGEEAFLPPTITDNIALFALERYEAGPWQFSLGGRIERQMVEAERIDAERSFNAFSVSTGASYRLNDAWTTGVTLSRTERGPSAEELYSNGAHLATQSFERGNAALGKETAWHAEWSLKRSVGDVTGGLNLFATRYRDFIFGDFTGAVEDDLQVLQYQQADADFVGGELELGWVFYRGAGYTLGVDGVVDYVEAKQRGGTPLPLIPPFGYTFGFNVSTTALDVRAEIDGVLDQERNAPNETETGGYTLLNTAITWRPFEANRNVALLLQGRNLTDEEGRNHISLLKNDARLGAKVTF